MSEGDRLETLRELAQAEVELGASSGAVQGYRVEAYRVASEAFAEPWALALVGEAERLTGRLARRRGEIDSAIRALSTASWVESLCDGASRPETLEALEDLRTTGR